MHQVILSSSSSSQEILDSSLCTSNQVENFCHKRDERSQATHLSMDWFRSPASQSISQPTNQSTSRHVREGRSTPEGGESTHFQDPSIFFHVLSKVLSPNFNFEI